MCSRGWFAICVCVFLYDLIIVFQLYRCALWSGSRRVIRHNVHFSSGEGNYSHIMMKMNKFLCPICRNQSKFTCKRPRQSPTKLCRPYSAAMNSLPSDELAPNISNVKSLQKPTRRTLWLSYHHVDQRLMRQSIWKCSLIKLMIQHEFVYARSFVCAAKRDFQLSQSVNAEICSWMQLNRIMFGVCLPQCQKPMQWTVRVCSVQCACLYMCYKQMGTLAPPYHHMECAVCMLTMRKYPQYIGHSNSRPENMLAFAVCIR